jgi:hypothetical protein
LIDVPTVIGVLVVIDVLVGLSILVIDTATVDTYTSRLALRYLQSQHAKR